MEYVIGIDGGSTKCLIKAKSFFGETIAEICGETTNHLVVGSDLAADRVRELISNLLQSFSGKKEDCRCIVVGASGLDSPRDRLIVDGFYHSLGFSCPIFCMNDGMVALHAVTKGVGLVAIAGTGSIVVGRNSAGEMTRSGGYSISIMGDEGSARWISVMALNHMSKWVDQSVAKSPLVQKMIDRFGGFDSNTLSKCTQTGHHERLISPEFAILVYEAAHEGDEAAIAILRQGARALFKVAETVVRKLGYQKDDTFVAGMWGSVFVHNEFFAEEYRRLFHENYPNSMTVYPKGDAADGAVSMAIDYLADNIPMIHEY